MDKTNHKNRNVVRRTSMVIASIAIANIAGIGIAQARSVAGAGKTASTLKAARAINHVVGGGVGDGIENSVSPPVIHTDKHNDYQYHGDYGHSDSPHVDTPHNDSHSDWVLFNDHTDNAHSDSAHQDVGHRDGPNHNDGHTDN